MLQRKDVFGWVQRVLDDDTENPSVHRDKFIDTVKMYEALLARCRRELEEWRCLYISENEERLNVLLADIAPPQDKDQTLQYFRNREERGLKK